MVKKRSQSYGGYEDTYTCSNSTSSGHSCQQLLFGLLGRNEVAVAQRYVVVTRKSLLRGTFDTLIVLPNLVLSHERNQPDIERGNRLLS